ncbi:electron transfer flavoprotein beta subunit/FixA family protein [Salibacterium salarium]|uniref:Electron transfer flavoprotein subunit beta n=1 Tax=Salibacterium salarium TaxID=284579 RepID=A0A3R9QKT3_9BACI|nr:electron transfer flavoprotein subunit beta/FixA family protein [Salibacterium salarium]RSL33000.1 electron transfer flavoprotein beta subunit/FixA family protein [Salibacterium salarium]
MNIFVIMKRTFDTEEKIVIENGKIDEEDAEFIINPYDEYALEEAVVLRDEHGGEVTVVTVGEEEAEKELRTALAMGADKAVLIDMEDVDEEIDHYSISEALTAYFQDKEVDIILAGNVAVDDGAGQVGPRVAEKLGINQVTTITNINLQDRNVKIERDVEGDVEYVETSLPLLVTCQQGLNEPRYPSLPGIMKAKKKPLETLDLDDLDLEEEEMKAKTNTADRFLPPEKQAGKVLQGETKDQVLELVDLLRNEAKVI